MLVEGSIYARYEIRLELVQVDVQATVETQGCSNAGNHLCDQPVEVTEAGRGNVQVLLADIVDGLIVNLFRALSNEKRH